MKKFLAVAVIAAMALMAVPAFAYDVKVDEDTFAKMGFKGISRFSLLEDAAATGTDSAFDVTVPNARVYFGGQVTNEVKFGFNFDMARAAGGASTTGLADGAITFDFAKELKVMAGMYRMAVTRVGLQDTYTFILPDAPMVAGASFLSSGYSSYRNAGVTLWGDLLDGMIRYNVGVWDGGGNAAEVNKSIPGAASSNVVTTGTLPAPRTIVTSAYSQSLSNPDDDMGVSARLVFNILDPEKGYTNSCCYLGKAKTFNVGLGYMQQKYALGDITTTTTQVDTGTAADYDRVTTVATTRAYDSKQTYAVQTVDAYFEANNITAEAAYLLYDYDDSVESKGAYAQVAYQIGNIQPALRYEQFDADETLVADNMSSPDYTRITAGVNYYLDGHNAKVALAYAMHDFDGDGANTRGSATATKLVNKDYSDVIVQLSVQF